MPETQLGMNLPWVFIGRLGSVPASADQGWLCPRHHHPPTSGVLDCSHPLVECHPFREDIRYQHPQPPSQVVLQTFGSRRQAGCSRFGAGVAEGETGSQPGTQQSDASLSSRAGSGHAWPTKGTRAGHPNRGPARKNLPECPCRASKSRAGALHRRTQHSACAGQHRWRQTPDTEKDPKDAS